jgi:hypothetical protein
MTQPCYQSLRAVRIRASKINSSTGAPTVGASNGVVSSAQIQAQIGITITTGDTGTQKNGDGVTCATFTDPDTLKNVTIALDLCSADPILRGILTSGTIFTDPAHASIAAGFQSLAVGSSPTPVCFELWTRAWDGSSQTSSTTTFGNGVAAYWHWVFPWTTWVEDQTTLSNGIHTLPLKGTGVANSAITANGPFNDWPTYVAQNGGVTQPYGYFLDSQLPSATCGFTAVPAGS